MAEIGSISEDWEVKRLWGLFAFNLAIYAFHKNTVFAFFVDKTKRNSLKCY